MRNLSGSSAHGRQPLLPTMSAMISWVRLSPWLRCARALRTALGAILCAVLALRAVVAAPTQDAQVLADFVTAFVRGQTQASHGAALQIQVEPVRRDLPACTDLHATMPKTLRSRSTIAVRCAAPKGWSLMVPVQLRLPGVQITAARTLSPGETVGEGDIRRVPADVLRQPADAVTDPAQALGRIVTQRIRQGGTIKSGALRDPDSVQRGQRVHTQARGAGFVMRGAGYALQAGARGSTIQVRTSSGAVVSAIVIDSATVQVPL